MQRFDSLGWLLAVLALRVRQRGRSVSLIRAAIGGSFSAIRVLDRLVEQAERHVHARGRWNESHHAMSAELQKASCQNQHGSDRRGPEQGSDEAHE
jgi:hypothetical protein